MAKGVSRHPRIRGQRTSLRATTHGDLDLLAGWFADPEVFRWWGGQALRRDEVAAGYTGDRSPEVESFLIEAEDKPVGYLQYWQDRENSGGLDMFLVPEARGQRLGPDAARAVAEFLFRQLGWEEVTADPLTENDRAIRAFARAGFLPDHEAIDEETGKPCLLMVARRSERLAPGVSTTPG